MGVGMKQASHFLPWKGYLFCVQKVTTKLFQMWIFQSKTCFNCKIHTKFWRFSVKYKKQPHFVLIIYWIGNIVDILAKEELIIKIDFLWFFFTWVSFRYLKL